ncbi:DMT family transporter [Pseudomonas syringae]|uniref:DMT family transporter n=1 Tax=Pseudomonas syringae TaxID=317 RepID=A0A6B2AZK9_PSESX|nr:DMT family transporter [Pseudomonas syringae]MDC6489680.1 DMT family transporter [Pseudomonas syringae]MDC6493620.1 DMT family transporter [Pseudomonas syringae]MDC6499508.1 DMT family transporter [Pseudomonas syringae]MDC6510200.1 DMT family transporter [Pseudomonas syringae]MDC6531077.1 DMT family transporter [Pseudomonas syringae]
MDTFRTRRLKGVGAALLAALCWGSSTVMSKGALEEFSPVVLLNVQLVSSLVFLWGVIIVFRIDKKSSTDIRKVAYLGLLEPGIAYFLGLIGLTWIAAGTASLIQATEALMIAFLCAFLFKERLSIQFLLLSGAALFGLVIVLGDGGFSVGSMEPLGQLLVFGGTLSAAIYVVLSSKVSGSINPLVMVAYQQVAAMVLALGALLLSGVLGEIKLPHTDAMQWTLAIVSGVIQYAVAFALYFYATRFISASSAGAFLCMVPVFGVAGGCVFLGESISPFQLCGGALTLVAISIMSIFFMPETEESLHH